jgi:hypothetical protein
MTEFTDILNTLPSFVTGKIMMTRDTDLKVYYLDENRDPLVAWFPTTIINCDKLLMSSSQAFFGHNDKAVVDTNIRQARYLEHPNFATNFDPNLHGIIDSIQSQMAQDYNIKLVLDKLNIYEEGGHFKTHKDTPQSPDMIGTLVVCLPAQFTGGDFILDDKVFNFDKDSYTSCQWIAFYGDIDHSIEPILSGVRITLTYSIVKMSGSTFNIDPTVLDSTFNIDPTMLQLFQNTIAPYSGKRLGYGCKYMYSSATTPVLKGDDALIYKYFTKLNCKVKITYVVNANQKDYDDICCDICDVKIDKNDDRYIDKNDEIDVCKKCINTEEGEEYIEQYGLELYDNSYKFIKCLEAPSEHIYVDATNTDNMLKNTLPLKDIIWINNCLRSDKEISIDADVMYGNYPVTHKQIYKHCTFIIEVGK